MARANPFTARWLRGCKRTFDGWRDPFRTSGGDPLNEPNALVERPKLSIPLGAPRKYCDRDQYRASDSQ